MKTLLSLACLHDWRTDTLLYTLGFSTLGYLVLYLFAGKWPSVSLISASFILVGCIPVAILLVLPVAGLRKVLVQRIPILAEWTLELEYGKRHS